MKKCGKQALFLTKHPSVPLLGPLRNKGMCPTPPEELPSSARSQVLCPLHYESLVQEDRAWGAFMPAGTRRELRSPRSLQEIDG